MKWVRGPTIGRGSTATVSVATAIPSGDLIAVKSAVLARSNSSPVLSRLSCSRIVKYIGHKVTTNVKNEFTYNLCMEFVSGGTLYDEIRRRGGRLDEDKIRIFAHQILQGLDYLHENGVAHCDIKSQNILIDDEEGVKLADLGCAKLIGNDAFPADEGLSTSAFSGTPAFMAPEVARGKEQGFAANIWALGCTIIEMATGNSPWPELNDPVSTLYRIGFSGNSPEIPSWFSGRAKNFLSKCLKGDAKERWTAKGLLEHPFLRGVEPNLKDPTITMTSPISVLDQGIWGSVRSSMDLIHEVFFFDSSRDSPAERIKRLIGSNSSADLDVPSWSWSGDWVTIRGNEVEVRKNSSIMAEEEDPSNEADHLGLDCSCEEDLEYPILDEELLLQDISDFSSNTANMADNFVLENHNNEISSSIQSNHSLFQSSLPSSFICSSQLH